LVRRVDAGCDVADGPVAIDESTVRYHLLATGLTAEPDTIHEIVEAGRAEAGAADGSYLLDEARFLELVRQDGFAVQPLAVRRKYPGGRSGQGSAPCRRPAGSRSSAPRRWPVIRLLVLVAAGRGRRAGAFRPQAAE
jgi:hypothetical protein